jgi:hypothetical protein
MPLLTLIACASILTGCGGLTASDRLRIEAAAARAKSEIPADRVDSALTQECDKAVQLPERQLSQAEIDFYWAQDRSSLQFCRVSKSGLIKVFRAREGQPAGARPQAVNSAPAPPAASRRTR